MDYSRYLILYSGGVDSTHFVETEDSAKHLIHYAGLNTAQTRSAVVNANVLNRFLTVVHESGIGNTRDGETNQIHALYDTMMIMDACSRALHHNMAGIVLCFNADDIGVEVDAILTIMRKVEPTFEILQPLRQTSEKAIRVSLRRTPGLRYVSCMYSEYCGSCPKCLKNPKP